MQTRRIPHYFLLLATTTACSHHTPNTNFPTTFQPPPIARSTSIHTFADYMTAMSTAQETYLLQLQAQAAMPAVWVTNQLAVFPSAPTKRYAQALATALQQHGITGTQISTTPGTETITYDELAKVAALTNLLRGPDIYSMDMPQDLWLDLLTAVVDNCPCDDAAIGQTGSILFIWNSGEPPHAQARQRWKIAVRTGLARIMDEKRPMNYTSVGQALSLDGAGEFIYTYLWTIDDPTGNDASDLLSGLHNAKIRALKFELPVDVRLDIKETIKTYDEHHAAWTETLLEIDKNLANIPSATRAMRDFCTAVNHHQDEIVVQSISPQLLTAAASPREILLGKGHDRIDFDFVASAYADRSLTLYAIVSGPAGTTNVSMPLTKNPETGRWCITEINWPKQTKK